MQSWTDLVKEFHMTFGLPYKDTPTLMDVNNDGKCRLNLISEELRELEFCLVNKDPEGIADSLGDLAYVVIGTAVTMGLSTPQETIDRKMQIFTGKQNLENYKAFIPYVANLHADYVNLAESIYTESYLDQVNAVSMFINDIVAFSNFFYIDIDGVFREVHRSNMSKVGGEVELATGKYVKPPTYSKPDLGGFVGAYVNA